MKVAPHNDEAERSLLGAIFLNRRTLDDLEGRIEPEDFYREAHRHIYRAMLELHDADRDLDLVTIGDYLDRVDRLEAIGGMDLVAEISNEVPSSAHYEHYAEIVKEVSTLRNFIDEVGLLVENAYDGVADVEEFLDEAEGTILDVAHGDERGEYRSAKEVLQEKIYPQAEKAFAAAARGEEVEEPGLELPWADFNKKFGKLKDGKLYIIAARPAMGKTSWGLQAAASAAFRGEPVAIQSQEMREDEVIQRVTCTEAKINARHIDRGDVRREEWDRYLKAVAQVSDAPIYVDDTEAMTPGEVRAKWRRLKSKHGLGLAMVDYLQLMQAHSRKINSRNEEIGTIAQELKNIAKELDIPVIALAQLNRGVESRKDKRPILKDLRASGKIEQAADLVAFLYRESYYEERSDAEGVAEIIVRKNRAGPTGTIELSWQPECTRFDDLSRRAEERYRRDQRAQAAQ